jgi:hypothetical protein
VGGALKGWTCFAKSPKELEWMSVGIVERRAVEPPERAVRAAIGRLNRA